VNGVDFVMKREKIVEMGNDMWQTMTKIIQ